MRVVAGLAFGMVAATVASCGSTGGGAGRASTAGRTTGSIESVVADPGAARGVTVTGATPAERRVVGELLPLLGAERAIVAVAFDEPANPVPSSRGIRIAPRGAQPRVRWLGSLFGEALAARLAGMGDRIGSLEVAGVGIPTDLPALRPGETAGVARRALGDAARAGFDADVRTYAIGGIWVTIRLSEHDLLVPRRTDWLTALHGMGRPNPQLGLDVVAPDGTSVFWSGYGICYGCSSNHPGPTPGAPLPASMTGPTKLTITVGGGTARPRLHQTVTADCAAGETAPSPACSAIIGDRYALLPPMPTDTTCAGGPGFASATITGQLGGVPVRRTYDNCTSVGARWISDLTAAGVIASE